jgi:hypothetical protein
MRRALLVIVALALIAVLARDLFQRQRASGYREGRAVAAGYARAAALDASAAEDAQLANDETAAGAMWAKDHALERASECPDYSAAFRRGCIGYLDGHGD